MIAASLLLAVCTQGFEYSELSTNGAYPRLRISAPRPLSQPKTPPKGKWNMSYQVVGEIRRSPNSAWESKFRVFGSSSETQSIADRSARFLLRLWRSNFLTYGLDHNPHISNGNVDIYLVEGGLAGGEQRLDDERIDGRFFRVNTIYIYQVLQNIPPLEWVRELSHEYGHAVLPAVGGFERPEDWANGHLGERIFLRRVMKQLGSWPTEDRFGVSAQDLAQYHDSQTASLQKKFVSTGLIQSNLSRTGESAMDHYLGLMIFMETILPGPDFYRAMELGYPTFTDAVNGIELALTEKSQIELNTSSFPVRSRIWLPVPKNTKYSGVKVLKTKNGWSLVETTRSKTILTTSSRQ